MSRKAASNSWNQRDAHHRVVIKSWECKEQLKQRTEIEREEEIAITNLQATVVSVKLLDIISRRTFTIWSS